MNLPRCATAAPPTCPPGKSGGLGWRGMVAGRPVWLLDEPTVSPRCGFRRAVRRGGAGASGGGAAVIATHIDLGLPEAQLLDLTFRARGGAGQPRL